MANRVNDECVQRLCDSYGNWFQNGVKNKCGNAARMTQDLYPYTSIFSPIKVGRLTIKNRIVMAPMGNLMMAEETGRPSEKMIEYFAARAKGGVGLITSGLIPISHGIDPTVEEINKEVMMPKISGSRTLMSGWRNIAESCHAYGARFFIQFTPGLGRVGPPTCLVQRKNFPVSASFNPNFYIPQLPCIRLTDHKLKRIIKNAGQAAADAKACEIDGVYLHGHEGYLLEQMTNPAFNRRVLGRYTDPHKFGIDMVKEIRHRVGPNYPIMYRIDLTLALEETYGERMNQVKSLKKFKNGRNIQATLEYMHELVKAGVDIFDVDMGCYDNWWLPHPPAGMPAGCFLDLSEIAKKYFKENNIKSNLGVEVPIVAVGKLGYPDLAEQALRDNKADMLMLGRPLLADAEWCNKAYAGKVKDICPCIGCQEGCVNEFVEGGHIKCAVNARTGFEDQMPQDPTPALTKKKIAVVGAGPAGVVFATTAARRGHDITLFEKSDAIGGKVRPGSVPAVKFDFKNYLEWLETQVKECEELDNFRVKYNTTVTNETLKEGKFDAVIFALGTKSFCPPIPGLDKVRHVEATALLSNPGLMDGANEIVVVGGGVVGCETAYYLSYEHGKRVKVVEMLKNFMQGACTANRGHLLHYMERNGVELYNAAKVCAFDTGKVEIEQNVSKGVPNPWNTWQPLLPENIPNPLEKKMGTETKKKTLSCDLVVLAMGGRPDDALYLEALRNTVSPEIYNIGDSFSAGRVLEANRAAYRLATLI